MTRSPAVTSTQAPIASRLAPSCCEPHRQPVAHRLRIIGRAGPDVAVQAHVLAPVDDHQVQHPIQVEVGQRATAGTSEADDARVLATLHEGAIHLAHEQVARVAHGVARFRLDVALGHEQVDLAIVVHVRKLGVPGGRRHLHVADVRLVGSGVALDRDVAIPRVGRSIGQGLQAVVGLAGEVDLGITVAVQVVRGDPHAPDVDRLPALLMGVEPWGGVRRHAPQLLLAEAVVVAVVRDAQVTPPGPIPVAEQHRQAAVAGRQRCRRRVPPARCVGTDQLIVIADVAAVVHRLRLQVVAERHGRQCFRVLPGRGERGRPGVASVEAPGLVGALEGAITKAAKQDVLAKPQDGQVDVPIRIDVQRIGADNLAQVGDGAGHRVEGQCSSHRAPVAEQRCRILAAGQVQVLPAVAVTVEDGDAAADEVEEVAGIRMSQPGGSGLLDVVRCRQGPAGQRPKARQGGHAPHADDEQAEAGRDPSSPVAGHALAASAASKMRSITRRLATASSGGTGAGCPSSTAAAKRSASTV